MMHGNGLVNSAKKMKTRGQSGILGLQVIPKTPFDLFSNFAVVGFIEVWLLPPRIPQKKAARHSN